MNIEWKTEFNSFNSWKGLMYKSHYDAIIAGKFLPPIEVDIDPVNKCNLGCVFCNNKLTNMRGDVMTREHLLNLISFFKTWGVKGICFAGGEPTLHPDLAEAMYLCRDIAMPVSILTNGTFKHNQLKAAADCCRWIGVSVDSACEVTYMNLKKVDMFDKVIDNIAKLAAYGANEVTYKFLLHPRNQNEVYWAIKTAKELGCHRIHIRPISFMNYQRKEDKYDIGIIEHQVERGRSEFEKDGFEIMYVKHKYNDNLHRKFEFKKCLVTPLIGIFSANGDITLCLDRKNDSSMVIGNHSDISKIPEIWGSQKHKDVIDRIKLKDCPKCTFNAYNEQIEKAVINNKMDWEFV